MRSMSRYDGPIATASSAARVCTAARSLSEYTAIAEIPSSRQVRAIRTAISPRLAISILRSSKQPLFQTGCLSGLDCNEMIRIRRLVPIFVCMVLTAQPRNRNGIATTGPDSPGLGPLDALMTRLMARYGVQGGGLAVGKDGRLVLAHGYGMADAERREPVKPESLFRIASVSKPFTSAAVMKLVEEGKLKLEDRAFDILSDLKPPAGAKVDPRINRITIRDLLIHAGGWDRDKSFDPMFIPIRAARAVGTPSPANCETVIRYMLGQPLQFDPGSRSNYSNFGYCILGR